MAAQDQTEDTPQLRRNERIRPHQAPLTTYNFNKLKEIYPEAEGMQDLFWLALIEYLELTPDELKDIDWDRGNLVKQYQIPLPDSMHKKLMKKTKGANTQEALQIAIFELLEVKTNK